jgi:exosortase family protein XrtM
MKALRRDGSSAFALRFLMLFLVLFAGCETLRGTSTERFVVDGLFVMPAAALVNSVSSGERVTTAERQLASPGARLNVLRGCEGIETILLVAAAVLAFPAGWRQRATGLLIGTSLAYGLGIARLALLYLSLRFAPQLFELLHGVVAPLVPVALLALFFMAWSGRARRVAPAP